MTDSNAVNMEYSNFTSAKYTKDQRFLGGRAGLIK